MEQTISTKNIEKLSHLLNRIESMVDAKEISMTGLISVVSEYKRIKSVEE